VRAKRGGARIVTIVAVAGLDWLPRVKGRVQAAIVGAKLAYERAIWHEMVTYFPPRNPLALNQHYSSFAPEDNFSNAVGVLAGYRAVLTPTVDFNTAADQAILTVLEDLGPATKWSWTT